MKQGNPRKRFGLVALIGAMLAGLTPKPKDVNEQELQQRRTFLLTNGSMSPIPTRVLNQRQKRKRARQTNRY